MSMIKCRDCGADISDQAQACPKCGCPMMADSQIKKSDKLIRKFKLLTKKQWYLLSAIAVLLIIGLICLVNILKPVSIAQIAKIADKNGYSYSLREPQKDRLEVKLDNCTITFTVVSDDDKTYEQIIYNLNQQSGVEILSNGEGFGYKYIFTHYYDWLNFYSLDYWHGDIKADVTMDNKKTVDEVVDFLKLIGFKAPAI